MLMNHSSERGSTNIHAHIHIYCIIHQNMCISPFDLSCFNVVIVWLSVLAPSINKYSVG